MSVKIKTDRKLTSVERWVRRRLGDTDHERRVARISRKLVHLTRDLHNLDSSHRRLLHAGALLHDVGRSVDDADHPRIGARMILKSNRLPLNKREKRAAAYLTRYHRDAVPRAGKDALLRHRDDHEKLRLVLALLRVADALDSRSLRRPPRLRIERRGRALLVTCWLDEETDKTRRVYRRRRKFDLLEELLGCRIEVDLRFGRMPNYRAMQLAA